VCLRRNLFWEQDVGVRQRRIKKAFKGACAPPAHSKQPEAHNHGNNPHTSKYKPWRIKTAIAFTDRQGALDFEAYLKSPSGRAFAKKRL